MDKRYWEHPACILCDYWWVILIFLVVCAGGWFLWDHLKPLELGTGDVQVTLRWENLNDLDLHVISPTSQHIYYSAISSSDGGQLDVDSNGACNQSVSQQPVENIFWPQGSAPKGEYQLWVGYYAQCQIDSVTPYTITLKVDGKIQEIHGVIGEVGEMKEVIAIDR